MRRIQLVYVILGHLFFTMTGLSQSSKDEASVFYKEAVKSFKSKDYQLADSLFTLSLTREEHPDTYYSRAVCRRYLSDTCGYCRDLNSASQLGDKESKKLMMKDCEKKDSLFVSGVFSQKEQATLRLKKVVRRTECLKFSQESYYNDSNRVVLAYEFYDEGDTLFTMCEQIPSYLGGTPALYNFIRMNVRYPPIARERGISGTTYIQFKVHSDGLASDYEIVKGVKGCLECDLEAARVIRSIGHWYPAKHNGRAVNSRMIFPVRFVIQ